MKTDKTVQSIVYKCLKQINELQEDYGNDTPDARLLDKKDKAFINEKIKILWENLKKIDTSSHFKKLRKIRNEISHKDDDFTDEELQNIWSKVFPKLDLLKSELIQTLEVDSRDSSKRKFKKFSGKLTGDEADRNQLIDAIEDACNADMPSDEKIEFPENTLSKAAESILQDTLGDPGNKKYISSHEGLSKNIQDDLLDWIKSLDKKLPEENPFRDEESFVQKVVKKPNLTVADEFPEITDGYKKVAKDSDFDFDFYRKQFNEADALKTEEAGEKEESKETEKAKQEKLLQLQKRKNEKKEAVAEVFKEKLQEYLAARKLEWQTKYIEEQRQKFLKELNKKLENFKKLEKTLSGFFGETGFLWDMSGGMFQNSGFELLKTYAALLEKDESLQELAKVLGHHSAAKAEYEKELREKVVIHTEYRPKAAYRGQISGIRLSNEISSVLPSELALLKNPATKKLFGLKFAQKQLLSYRYESMNPVSVTHTEMEEVSKEKEKEKGPVIICVDTSGSMAGGPENIAKTVTFALTKIAVHEKRKCYLISFSTGIQTLDLSDFCSSGKNPLATLISFLKMSFNGGTDAMPALKHSLKMLQSEDYRNADVLMISDFVMGNLNADLVNQINAEKEKGTDFYSLVIGNSGNQSTISCFNYNWEYNMNDRNAARHLIEQLDSVKKNREAKMQNSENKV